MNTSLDALKLMNRLKELGVELSIAEGKLCIDAPKGVITARLHEELTKHKNEIKELIANGVFAPVDDLPAIRSAGRNEKIPLSFSQQRIWFLCQMDPHHRAYILTGAIRMHGQLNKTAFQRSLNEIYRRHDALRTSFKETDGEPEQIISPPTDFALETADLSTGIRAEHESELQELFSEDVRRSFDLVNGPLFRGKLIRLGEEEHVFFWTMHHLISDGWSKRVFLSELSTFYRAFYNGMTPSIPEMPIQYADYAIWQRKCLQGEVLQRHLDYWKRQLGGELPVLQLPTDRPRPAVQSYRGAKEPIQLSQQRLNGLKEVSQEEDVTLFMTLLASLYTLLYRYTGQKDITIGFPIANRTRTEIENLIGFFVNTLVLRIDLSGPPSFNQLLDRVREATVAAYQHQDLPFEKLVEEIKPVRDMSFSPLFQMMFTWQNIPLKPGDLPGLILKPISIDTGASMFDLTIYMWEEDGGLAGQIEYNTDLFDRSTIVRIYTHFQTLIKGIIKDPHDSISNYPMLDEAERRRLLVEWNDTAAAYPRDRCLHDLFEEQVKRTPDAVAVVYKDQKLTYRQLNARANQLAHHLVRLGVGPEVMVGLFAERSLEMIIAIYGIIKAGGAYVPLDPEYPGDRIAFMLADTRVPVLLTQQHLAHRLEAHQATVICLDSDWGRIAGEGTENPPCRATPENPAYVIYTSGSTGRPKGVVNEHRGIVNRLMWMQEEYGLTTEDRVLQKTPFSFDVSVWEFFWPLQVGASLVVAEPGGHRDSAYLVDLIQTHGITTIHFVPSMLEFFLEEDRVSKCTSLKRVICSGEALSVELQRKFFERLDSQLHNLYGPTEAAVDVTYWRCRKHDESSIVPIGFPVANTQIYILDPNLSPVPVGVSGELYIGGVQVARGYLNRPDLTAERFIPDPFSKDPKAKLYKSGDLARYRADGAIEYLGRIDFQVKIRGLRIELGEIEATIDGFDEVSRSVVAVWEAASGDKRLVAYYTEKPDRTVDVSRLRLFLENKLPPYMVPQHFIPMDSIPLTQSGKADRKALPKPELPKAACEYKEPAGRAEAVVAEIWRKLLGRDRIGVRDNFFDLGGHSLLVLQMVGKLKRQFSKPIAVVDVFQFPTVERLAAYLSDAESAGMNLGKSYDQGIRQREALKHQRRRMTNLKK
jgi:amino acid adenylation domain-containing protein